MQSGHPERRVYPRFPVEIEVTLASEHNFFLGFTENISEGGLFVATAMVGNVGDQISVNFSLPNREVPVEANGVVRWVRPYAEGQDSPSGMGVQFTDLDREVVEAIRAFVAAREPIFYDD